LATGDLFAAMVEVGGVGGAGLGAGFDGSTRVAPDDDDLFSFEDLAGEALVWRLLGSWRRVGWLRRAVAFARTWGAATSWGRAVVANSPWTCAAMARPHLTLAFDKHLLPYSSEVRGDRERREAATQKRTHAATHTQKKSLGAQA
jgi:hypothetical protein